jgi:hypothetical protein
VTFAALSRSVRLVVPTVVLVVAVFVAGEFGMAFLSTNDAIYSFGMRAMVLVALLSTLGVISSVGRIPPTVVGSEPIPTPSAPPA